jgi:hypothetical protein
MIQVGKNSKRTPVPISEVTVLMPRTGEEVINGKRDIVLHHRRVGFQIMCKATRPDCASRNHNAEIRSSPYLDAAWNNVGLLQVGIR